jgi:hypothetical protein
MRGTVQEELVIRRGDRRQPRRFYWGAERRSGFDRRTRPGAFNALLLMIRDNPAILFTLLVSVNVMNVLDFLFTVGALEAGYAEGNPLMAVMFARSQALAGGFKFLTVAAVSVVVWRMRRYRSALLVALFAFAVFGCILLLHAYGMLFFY